jgi:tripartite-type tricarboxylate transporter receptor subunit TctC
MNSNRRRVTGALGAVAASLAVPAGRAHAQDRPPLKLMVGFAPGGSADIVARLLAERMRVELNQPVLVENRPGAAGRIALEAVKVAAPDGQTLAVLPSGPMVVLPHVFRKLGYDPFKDFTPIAQVCSFQFDIVSGPASNVKSIADMAAKAKADPASATFGSSGNGTLPHFLGVMLADAAKIPLTHVPFQGGAPAVQALMGGHIGYTIDTLVETMEMYRAGKVKVVAVTGPKRSPQMPEVPTLKEQGVDMEATGWFAVYGPAGMAPDVVRRLNQAANAVLKDPAAIEKLSRLGLEPVGSTPEQLAAAHRADYARWEKPIKATGFTAD